MQPENELPTLSELMTLAEYATRVGISHATAWRHCAVGIGGVRLRSVLLGRRRMTCERWVVEFAAAVEAAKRNAEEAPAETEATA